ncbi:MAG TPA: hypothetical protein VFV83_05380 [Chthoniobacteraceae bacterium]|nr:hypothetical protein [Chthoniobacteraceae bacterium]
MTIFSRIALLMTSFATLLGGSTNARGEPSAIPAAVTAANYPDLLEKPPFRRVLALSESLVLSGVATLPSGKVVTVWDRASGRSFIVTANPNAQGWKLIGVSENTDLRSVEATIAAGDQKLTLRFDPERLTPPKLDNTSKPAPRNEGAVVVEALLRSLQPAVAKDFEALPAEAQETFRKSFSDFLATYPTANDAKRLEFVQRTLDEVRDKNAEKPLPASKTLSGPSPPPVPPRR